MSSVQNDEPLFTRTWPAPGACWARSLNIQASTGLGRLSSGACAFGPPKFYVHWLRGQMKEDGLRQARLDPSSDASPRTELPPDSKQRTGRA
eukprot:11613121-Alexandrium_andersonii.AAC.2